MIYQIRVRYVESEGRTYNPKISGSELLKLNFNCKLLKYCSHSE